MTQSTYSFLLALFYNLYFSHIFLLHRFVTFR